MKKLFKGILCAALCAAAVLGSAACGGKENTERAQIYAPDGAPALALTSLLAGEEEAAEKTFDVEVVNAQLIQTYVTGEKPKADFCILPLNAAANTVGTGEVYQMLGTVTNGNLYFLTDTNKDLPALTAENLSEALLGKTLGAIQYEQVPGLTLRVVLEQYEIPYDVVEENSHEAGKVHIRPIAPETVVPGTGCDYYLCPEPARTTKISATSASPNPFRAAGSLQELYGGEGGYPQAVLVAKKAFIAAHKDIVEKVISYMENSENYLKTATPETIVKLLDGRRTSGMGASFTVGNLNSTVIANCSVRFTKSENCKAAVLEFLTKLRGVAPATKTPADEFFYTV